MRALVQRVDWAEIIIDNKVFSTIKKGLLIFVGVEHNDNGVDVEWVTHKTLNMRIFEDVNGKMNQSLLDIKGEILVVSQFTLHASTKKGNRPSFIQAARPEKAVEIYDAFIWQVSESLPVKTGKFGADMQVVLQNNGPVTIWLDSKRKE